MIHSKRRTVFSTVVVTLRHDDGVISGISLACPCLVFNGDVEDPGMQLGLGIWAHSVVARYIQLRTNDQSGSVP